MNANKKLPLSVIYDITKQCPWNCPICCMGALPNPQARNNELTLSEKLSLMEQLALVANERDVHIDFSGGEIFTNLENVLVLEYAASLLGREKVGVSSSGFRIDDALAKRLSHCISECEMTMDHVPGKAYPFRPKGYHLAAANALPHLQKYGITTGIQTVLANANCEEDHLRSLYQWLCDHQVNNWSLLRFYPSGRGQDYKDQCISEETEAYAVHMIQQMDRENLSPAKPKIDFHYTIKGHAKYSQVCRCVRKSIGILPDGRVTSCFWAVDADMNILDDKFYLGSVKELPLTQLLSGPNATYWMSCEHSCEIAHQDNASAA